LSDSTAFRTRPLRQSVQRESTMNISHAFSTAVVPSTRNRPNVALSRWPRKMGVADQGARGLSAGALC
jgi:hypothetical protein